VHQHAAPVLGDVLDFHLVLAAAQHRLDDVLHSPFLLAGG
jgi:hypothetical protein